MARTTEMEALVLRRCAVDRFRNMFTISNNTVDR